MMISVLERPRELTANRFKVNLEKALEELKTELTASTKLDGFSSKGWARIDVDGEDHEILEELIIKKFGRAHKNLHEIEIPGVYDSILAESSSQGLEADVGIESPSPLTCILPLGNLVAQLADGKPTSCRQLIENYCLFPGVKISVRITKRRADAMQAWLSDSQMNQFSDWITEGLDRIQIFDCYKQDVESAILKAGLSRDIITVEPITLTVQSVICKLGTDAIGLIPKLGSVLRRCALRPFVPKRIMARCRPW